MVKQDTGYKCSSCNHGVEPKNKLDNENDKVINYYVCEQEYCHLQGKIQTTAEEPYKERGKRKKY